MAQVMWTDFLLGKRVAARLVWIAISFLLPLAVLLGIYWNSVSQEIESAQKELAGIVAERALFDALIAVDRQEVLQALRVEGNEKASASDAVERALDRLDRIFVQQMVVLELSDEGFRARKRAWANPEELRRAWRSTNPSQRAKTQEIILEQILHIADTSGLILDPDLDTFYLMDAAVMALPVACQRLTTMGQLLAQGEAGSALELGIASRRLREDILVRFCKDVETALVEDLRFRGETLDADGLAQASDSLRRDLSWICDQGDTAARRTGKADNTTTLARRILDSYDVCHAGFTQCSQNLEGALNNRISRSGKVRLMGLSLTAVALVLALGLVWWIGATLVGPISASRSRLVALAQGNLADPVCVMGHGELREMTASLDSAVRSMRVAVAPIRLGAAQLAISVKEQAGALHYMASNAEETSAQVQMVSAAAEQVSTNVRSVAAAAEEMEATIREIASQAHQAARVAGEAVGLAESTGTLVNRLGESGSKIGGVVKTITSIAEQTNLLALNATIEAARAGEVGKGFAVVANEVKELAKETARATEDIGGRIHAIQEDTRQAIAAITKIQAIITRINEIQVSIAAAVEEQAATTREIGRNVTEAAKGTGEIAANITGVADSARNTSDQAQKASLGTEELRQLSLRLEELVRGFRTE